MLLNIFVRVRPSAVGMRIVRGPDHLIFAQIGEKLEANVVFLKRDPNLAMKQLTRFRLNADQGRELFVEFMIHPPQEIRHPANASLSQHDSQGGMRLQRSAEDDLTQRFVELHRHCRHKRGNLAPTWIGWPGVANPPAKVKAEGNASLGSYSPHRFPVFMKDWLDSVKHAEQYSLEAQFSNSLEFFGGGYRVVHR